MKYVLKDRLTHGYFRQMTAIGPMQTYLLVEAFVFSSKEEATRSPVYFHALSFFEPVDLQGEMLTARGEDSAA